jgi:hypothetical protein
MVCQALVAGAAMPETTTNVFECSAAPTAEDQIDKLVFAELARLKIDPVLCSDAVFVRRAYLDVIGLAAHREGSAGVHSRSRHEEQTSPADRPPARARRVRRLLGDEVGRPAAHQGGVPRQPLAQRRAGLPSLGPRLARRQQALRPVRARMLTASGSNFPRRPGELLPRHPEPHADGIAGAVALTFMGARAELCWPAKRLAGMAVFFSQVGYKPTSEWKEEHVFWDPLGTSTVAGNTAPGRAAVTAIGTPPSHQRRHPAPGRCRREPSAAGRRFPDGTKPQAAARPRSARALRRLADCPEEPVVHRSPRTASGRGCWARHRPRTRRHPARQPALATPRCSPTSRRSSSRALRS